MKILPTISWKRSIKKSLVGYIVVVQSSIFVISVVIRILDSTSSVTNEVSVMMIQTVLMTLDYVLQNVDHVSKMGVQILVGLTTVVMDNSMHQQNDVMMAIL
jgi:hypothetical protein